MCYDPSFAADTNNHKKHHQSHLKGLTDLKFQVTPGSVKVMECEEGGDLYIFSEPTRAVYFRVYMFTAYILLNRLKSW